MAISVKLQVFEGPLDLLLHLIDVNKIDIYDIPISLITDQYLSYIEELQNQDMDVMSEFLVMAATLLRIKSKMLLPVEKGPEDEEGDGDPRTELVARLLEYKMYKYAASELKDLELDASKSMYKGKTIPTDLVYEEPPVDLDELVGDMDIKKLHEIFKRIMKRQTDKIDPIRSKYGKIEQEEINLSDKITEIHKRGRQTGRLSFMKMLSEHPTRLNAVMTFLAILELMKSGRIKVSQEELFDDIVIDYIESEPGEEAEGAEDASEDTSGDMEGGYDAYE